VHIKGVDEGRLKEAFFMIVEKPTMKHILLLLLKGWKSCQSHQVFRQTPLRRRSKREKENHIRLKRHHLAKRTKPLLT
jgi:hypothetical protein